MTVTQTGETSLFGGTNIPDQPAPKNELRSIRDLGTIVFIIQFIALVLWSLFMYQRFSGTRDEALFFQTFFEISRGHFAFVHTLLQDHASYLLLALTPIDWLGPPGLALLWAQDLAAVAAGFIAFRWMLHIVDRERRRTLSLGTCRWLLITGLVLLVANPWTYWAISFDVHIETFAAPFAIAAAFDFCNRRFGRAWIWVALVILSGDVTSTWLAGLALSSIIAASLPHEHRRQYLINAFGLLGVLGLWTEYLRMTGLGQENRLSTYYGSSPASVANLEHGGSNSGFQMTAAHFATKVARSIHTQLHNFYANIAPAGLIGVATTWTIGVPLVAFAEDALTNSFLFTQPFYQLFPLYSFIAVGTVIALVWMFSKLRRMTILISRIVLILICVNCIAWAAIFIPHIKENWVHVSKSQAATLANIEETIPESNEVFASQGVAGRFANRAQFHILRIETLSNLSSPAWFVVAPEAGIEYPVQQSEEIIRTLNSLSGVKLISYQNGIYLYKWTRPDRTTRVTLGGSSPTIPASSALGPSGVAIPTSNGHGNFAQSNGSEGYVVEGDYWNLGFGNYEATVRLKSNAPSYVEVWDATARRLLERRELENEPEMTSVNIPFSVHDVIGQAPGYHGVGPFSFNPVPPFSGDQIEIRVWQSGGYTITVSTLSVAPR